MRKKLTIGSWTMNLIKSFDRFGQPISLKFRNNNTYRSTIGGLMTIMVYTVLLVYLSLNLKAVFLKEEYTVQSSTERFDIAFDNRVVYLNKTNFDIGVHLLYTNIDDEI